MKLRGFKRASRKRPRHKQLIHIIAGTRFGHFVNTRYTFSNKFGSTHMRGKRKQMQRRFRKTLRNKLAKRSVLTGLWGPNLGCLYSMFTYPTCRVRKHFLNKIHCDVELYYDFKQYHLDIKPRKH